MYKCTEGGTGDIWYGLEPTECDTCGGPLTDTFYDALTPFSWAIICQECFDHFDCTLGIGRGQKYQRIPEER